MLAEYIFLWVTADTISPPENGETHERPIVHKTRQPEIKCLGREPQACQSQVFYVFSCGIFSEKRRALWKLNASGLNFSGKFLGAAAMAQRMQSFTGGWGRTYITGPET